MQKGAHRMKSDICMYPTTDPNELIGASIIHVDDILYVGTNKFVSLVESAITQFRVGGTEISKKEKGIAFTGLEIQSGKCNRIILPQKQYVSELPKMDISQYVNKNQLANQKDSQITFLQWLGALIWVRQ